jgi:RAB protein geranylgeranyltransferase component A
MLNAMPDRGSPILIIIGRFCEKLVTFFSLQTYHRRSRIAAKPAKIEYKKRRAIHSGKSQENIFNQSTDYYLVLLWQIHLSQHRQVQAIIFGKSLVHCAIGLLLHIQLIRKRADNKAIDKNLQPESHVQRMVRIINHHFVL